MNPQRLLYSKRVNNKKNNKESEVNNLDNSLFNAIYDVLASKSTKADICKKYNITRSALDWNLKDVLRETDKSKKLRHQMFLGAKLGDGYFQKTKNNVYKYRESHGIGEFEYAKWKYLILQSYHKNTRVVPKNSGKACEVYTSASCSQQIKPYYDMSVEDTIKSMNIYGFLFYLLDDGWYSSHSKVGNYLVGSKILTIEQKKMIINLLNRYEIEASIVGIREDISIHSKYNFTLLSYLTHIAPTLDIDIINKKFGKIIKNTLMA